MSTPLLAIGPAPLALEPLVAAVTEGGRHGVGADGAVTTFLGLVRNHNAGRSVRYLEYEAYEPLARRAFERIAAEIEGLWPGVRLALHHRTGRLEIELAGFGAGALFDKVNVTGVATLAGTLEVQIVPGACIEGSYQIMTYASVVNDFTTKLGLTPGGGRTITVQISYDNGRAVTG